MAQKKTLNPFYAAALPVGVVFAVTACAYVVMMVQAGDARRAEPTGLIAALEQHGILILGAELAILGVLTFAAIFTDDFWTKRCAAANSQPREPEVTAN